MTTQGRIIIVEGNIASGKSTLIDKLCEKVNLTQVKENLPGSPYLELFNLNPNKYSLPLQHHHLATKFKQYQSAMRKANRGKDVILDYSIYSCITFARACCDMGYVTDVELESLKDIYNKLVKKCRRPDITIYLDCKAKSCMSRITNDLEVDTVFDVKPEMEGFVSKGRSRKCESNITIEYLQALEEHYKALINKLDATVVDNNNFNTVLKLLK